MQFESKCSHTLERKLVKKDIETIYFDEDGQNNQYLTVLNAALTKDAKGGPRIKSRLEDTWNDYGHLRKCVIFYEEVEESDQQYAKRIEKAKEDDIRRAFTIVENFIDLLERKEELLKIVREKTFDRHRDSVISESYFQEKLVKVAPSVSELEKQYEKGKIDGAKEERERIKKKLSDE